MAAVLLMACATLSEPAFISVSVGHDRTVTDEAVKSRRAALLTATLQAACAIPDRTCLGPESYAVRMFIREKSCDIALAVRIDDALKAQPLASKKILSVAELSCGENGSVQVVSYN